MPVTARSTPHSSIRKSMLAIELTPSTMRSAGCLVSFERLAHAGDVAGDAGGRLVVGEEHRLDLVTLVGRERVAVALDRRAFTPLGVEHVHLEAEPLGHVDPEVAEHPEPGRRAPCRRARAYSPSEASQAPVPLAGKMNAWPGRGLEDLLELVEERTPRARESRTSGDPPWRDAWRGGYGRARWWARERRGSCGRPCADPRAEGKERPGGSGTPPPDAATLEGRALNNSCARTAVYNTLHLFSQARSVSCPIARPCPIPTASFASSTRWPPPRWTPAPRWRTAFGARHPSWSVRPRSSPSARRRCRWRRPRVRRAPGARSRARGRLGRAARGGRLAPPLVACRSRRPSGARPRLPRRRRGARRRPRRGARTADEVWVLLSGGATSLLGAPVDGIAPTELTRHLLPAARLRPRHHRDEPHPQALLPLGRRPSRPRARAGSGPGLHRLRRHRRRPGVHRLRPLRPRPRDRGARCAACSQRRRALGPLVPTRPGGRLAEAEAGRMAETPKPGDQAFARVTLELIASNGLALEAAAKRAAELGLAPVVSDHAARRGGVDGRNECSRYTSARLRRP